MSHGSCLRPLRSLNILKYLLHLTQTCSERYHSPTASCCFKTAVSANDIGTFGSK